MFAIKTDQMQWTPGKQAGVERSILWEVPGGGRTSIIRIAKGATIEMHGHLGREEVYVISGKMRLGDDVIATGDYHHTSVGERHDVEALEDTVFYASTEKVIPGR